MASHIFEGRNMKPETLLMNMIAFMFFKKAIKIDEIFTVDLMLCSKRQIDGEDFVNFRGLLRKYNLYLPLIRGP